MSGRNAGTVPSTLPDPEKWWHHDHNDYDSGDVNDGGDDKELGLYSGLPWEDSAHPRRWARTAWSGLTWLWPRATSCPSALPLPFFLWLRWCWQLLQLLLLMPCHLRWARQWSINPNLNWKPWALNNPSIEVTILPFTFLPCLPPSVNSPAVISFHSIRIAFDLSLPLSLSLLPLLHSLPFLVLASGHTCSPSGSGSPAGCGRRKWGQGAQTLVVCFWVPLLGCGFFICRN